VTSYTQDSKKVLSGRPGQVDFPPGQVIFRSLLPVRQEIRQVICQLNGNNIKSQSKLRLAQGKQNFRSYLSQGQAGIQVFFSSPVYSVEVWSVT